MNDTNRPKAWSKYSKEAAELAKKAQKKAAAKLAAEKKASEKLSKAEKKEKKLERLIGDLKDDVEFKEFLAANKAISSKDNIWKNDFGVAGDDSDDEKPAATKETKSSKKKNGKTKTADGEEGADDEKTTDAKTEANEKPEEDEKEIDFENGRLFVRNLSYECREEDLEKLFAQYGPLVECSMPLDNFSKKPKGFAYITCMFPEKALKAHTDLDGSIFQGRMLHILPAQTKREMDEEEERKLGFKQKKASFSFILSF